MRGLPIIASMLHFPAAGSKKFYYSLGGNQPHNHFTDPGLLGFQENRAHKKKVGMECVKLYKLYNAHMGE